MYIQSEQLGVKGLDQGLNSNNQVDYYYLLDY